MAHDINHILARFENEPALMREGHSVALLQSCAHAVINAAAEISKVEASEGFWPDSDDDYRSYYRPYKVQDGILTIPVKGLLLNNFSVALGDYATGYEYIWQAVKRGMADRQVNGIVFRVESGGGMVSGNFDLVDRIYALRGQKPMRTITEDGAYSAAYSIASAADKIIVGRSGGVGSIGVVTIHMEMSKALDARGVTVNIIRSKPRKMEGNAYEALTDEARAGIQSRIDAMHQQFVAIVARNRDMREAEVDGTDALCFMPAEAIERKLADQIGNAEDAFTAFVASFNSQPKKGYAMAITEEEHTAALAVARTEAAAAARIEAAAAARTEAATAERARISAILGSDAAKERPVAAQMVAFDTDKSADDAVAWVAKFPVEKAAAPVAPVAASGAQRELFTAAMGNTENPNLNAGTGDEQNGAQSRVAATLAMVKGAKA